ncbi:MAG TPA: HAD family hydrolase [Candidatus Binatia bacterium]|jgi:HAD superfamily hydrolase (TIGR01549 family)
MTSGVIFDIDGTLIDSVDLHAKSWEAAFVKFGKRFSLRSIRRQIGKGSDQLLPVFLTAKELKSFGNELDKYRSELFKKEYLPHVKSFPKVRELFVRLRGDGKKIALASSAKADELETYKRIARIHDLVQTETSSDDADRSKPHPDIFAAALEKLPGVGVANIVVVGDTGYDAAAAGKMHLRTIGVLCGGWEEKELRAAGCVEIYRDPADLLARYEQSRLG